MAKSNCCFVDEEFITELEITSKTGTDEGHGSLGSPLFVCRIGSPCFNLFCTNGDERAPCILAHSADSPCPVLSESTDDHYNWYYCSANDFNVYYPELMIMQQPVDLLRLAVLASYGMSDITRQSRTRRSVGYLTDALVGIVVVKRRVTTPTRLTHLTENRTPKYGKFAYRNRRLPLDHLGDRLPFWN